ncbi:hypothetical protein Taro_034472 [Colocasia esculenta]|uniref:Uncharacterized protein n=1 Tax=Colocasia esculenta TaxID=4460 RepID=A0A843VWH9_COLES|nr:hypothetical protein [Colocasia esculenta]
MEEREQLECLNPGPTIPSPLAWASTVEMKEERKVIKKFFAGRREELQMSREAMSESLGHRLRQPDERGKKVKRGEMNRTNAQSQPLTKQVRKITKSKKEGHLSTDTRVPVDRLHRKDHLEVTLLRKSSSVDRWEVDCRKIPQS